MYVAKVCMFLKECYIKKMLGIIELHLLSIHMLCLEYVQGIGLGKPGHKNEWDKYSNHQIERPIF